MTMSPGQSEFHLLERPDHFVRAQQAGKGSRGGALAFTVALHIAVVLALIAGLHAHYSLPPQPIVAQLDTVKKKPEPPPPPPPQMVHSPEATIAIPPPVVIQTVPPPPQVEAPRAVIAPPAPPVVAGEGRDAFLSRLLSQLNRFKHYPPEADRRKQEGRVLVRFTIARDGRILDPAIARSSGYPLLDAAALRMLRDGSPVPPLPRWYAGDRATLTMPVDFSIGFFEKLFD